MMAAKLVEALDKLNEYLVNSINTDALLPAALSRGLILDRDRSACYQEADSYKKAAMFLVILRRVVNGDPDKFYTFLEILEKTNHKQVSSELRKQVHVSPGELKLESYDSMNQGAPQERGANSDDKLSTAPATESTDGKGFSEPKKDMTLAAEKRKMNDIYTMDSHEKHQRHGIALIVNNIKWEQKEFEDRDGAEKDGEALQKSLKDLNFKVIYKPNLKKQEMIDILQGLVLSKDEQPSDEKICPKDDSFICCVLSHGDEKGVYGVDAEFLSVDNLCKIIEPDKCKELKNKPKIFFIQACRGDNACEPIDGPPDCSKVPRGADFYISYATDSGCVALRHAFPERLSKALAEHSDVLSLDEIVMSVHKKLASDKKRVKIGDSAKQHLQIGQVVHTMREPVYFM